MPNTPELGQKDRWEELVTEGHVHAARLRWVQVPLIVTAIALIGFGLALASARIGSTPANASGGISNGAARRAAEVMAAVDGLPQMDVHPDQMSQLPLTSQLPATADTLLNKLNNNTSWADDTTIVDVTPSNFWEKPDAFWREPWQVGRIVVVKRGAVALAGIAVNEGGPVAVYPARWLGVFQKHNGNWRMLSASIRGFYVIPGQPSAALQDIPLTLAPVLPNPPTGAQ